MKNKRTVFFFLAFLVILSLGCSLLGSDNDDEEAAVVVEEAAPAEAAQEPTLPEPTLPPPTVIPPTEEPPTPEPTPVPSWRMAPPEGSFLMVQDSDKDPQWEEISAMHAAALAIPAPYYYELYMLPDGIRFPEVQDHYAAEMSARGYNMARNEQSSLNEMYLLTFLYKLDKTSKNAVLFFAELSNREPMALVIYYQPVED